MSNQRNFQVDLRGIIELLSDHLYSGPEVYLRELLQNSVDALRARELKEIDFVASESPVQLELVGGKPGTENVPTLVVTDNGVGLTESEIHQFLSTIGNSSKRDFSRDDFLGQFGIGLLSGFIVSEEIVVVTRSIEPGSPTLQWRGKSDGTYEIEQLKHEANPGTQVYLRCKPTHVEFMDAETVQHLSTYYASHLPMPIDFVHAGVTERINVSPPWEWEESDTGDHQSACLEYGEKAFQQQFIAAVPMKSETGGIDGFAYVLPYASRVKTQRGHKVYLKNMLLSDSVDNLMPDWSFFVRCVLNSTKLRPTANREGFHEDKVLEQTRKELGECLKSYLTQLSSDSPELLEKIISMHRLSIKALAVEDDEFFDLVIDWLPFETSLGTMQLGDYRKNQKAIRFVKNRDEFRQIVGVAAAQKICIIDAGYTYDKELLDRLKRRNPSRLVEQIDVSELAHEFGELSIKERNSVFDFLQQAEEALAEFDCRVDLKRFMPESLPVLYTHNAQAGFKRSIEQTKEITDELWGSILGSVPGAHDTSAKAQLCLNYSNPLARKLTTLRDRQLLRHSLQMLYVQALLLGHYPLQARETDVLNGGLIELINAAVRNSSENSSGSGDTHE